MMVTCVTVAAAAAAAPPQQLGKLKAQAAGYLRQGGCGLCTAQARPRARLAASSESLDSEQPDRPLSEGPLGPAGARHCDEL
jgi:hypothetical protein